MKFKIGEIYKDREGREYQFIAHCSESGSDERTIFLSTTTKSIVTRYENGSLVSKGIDLSDILPPEMKTLKLYQALRKGDQGNYLISDTLYETKPDDAIRLVTEYQPVVVEVEE